MSEYGRNMGEGGGKESVEAINDRESGWAVKCMCGGGWNNLWQSKGHSTTIFFPGEMERRGT